ncbi:MAG: amidohydrolase family protein, partial [Acidimicrobiales bacterium]
MDIDLVVKGGTVVTAADVTRCDVGISGGRIVALADGLTGKTQVDATGLLVLPGGIDAHCHLAQQVEPGVEMADGFESGTRSAACGGTTTVISFAAQRRGATLREAVEEYHRKADDSALIDYGFHMIITDPTPAVLHEELPRLVSEGYTSFKIYMTYEDLKLDDRQIIECLAAARATGARTMIHAENSDCISWLTEVLEAAGQTAPRYHASSRPPLVEREATHRAISLAELIDVSVLIVHVSGAEAIEQIRWGQARGLDIHAETCPQYLFLTADDLDRDGFEGAKYVCSPPPRDAANQEAVWTALRTGVLDVFSSDHAPFRFNDPAGKMANGVDADFADIP